MQSHKYHLVKHALRPVIYRDDVPVHEFGITRSGVGIQLFWPCFQGNVLRFDNARCTPEPVKTRPQTRLLETVLMSKYVDRR